MWCNFTHVFPREVKRVANKSLEFNLGYRSRMYMYIFFILRRASSYIQLEMVRQLGFFSPKSQRAVFFFFFNQVLSLEPCKVTNILNLLRLSTHSSLCCKFNNYITSNSFIFLLLRQQSLILLNEVGCMNFKTSLSSILR